MERQTNVKTIKALIMMDKRPFFHIRNLSTKEFGFSSISRAFAWFFSLRQTHKNFVCAFHRVVLI